jgi:uncharacterized protein (UPF0332 family)
MMHFVEKARENLEAVDRLLPDDTGDREPLSNAAASRAYYAAYLAVAERAQHRSIPFTGHRDYYRHDDLPNDGLRWGILTEDLADGLRFLHGLRIKADYQEDQVSLEEASNALDVARELLEALLVEAEGA